MSGISGNCTPVETAPRSEKNRIVLKKLISDSNN